MASLPDKRFELAVVDPPYGIGENWKKDIRSPFYAHRSSYKNERIPSERYFQELLRVSKHQIIWGGSYFTRYLPPRSSWIVWDKKRDYVTQHMAEGEMAWTSFNIPLRIVRYLWCGAAVCEPRSGIHPHEKPIALYRWLLKNYAKKGDRIFDSHVGSGAIRIAAYGLGLDFYGCEIDRQYFEAQEKRFRERCFGEVALHEKIYKQQQLF
jgi:site-specific DNA-methyltransferase (adenine-specific)